LEHSQPADAATATAATGPAAGVDVSSLHLDLHVLSEPAPVRRRFANDADGAAALAALLASCGVSPAAVEATGGYERHLTGALLAAGVVPVALVNPKRVRDFAKALGWLEKTDRVDAAVLARFARDVRPRTLSAEDPDMAELRDLVARRRQLVDQCVANTNQLRTARSAAARESVRRTLDHLEAEVAAVEALIQANVDADPALRARFDALCGVVGVGPRTARVLVAELPELGDIGSRAVAKLVGVAPLADDSGAHSGARTIRGGRATARRALYMIAVTAVRWNPVIKPYYAGLRARGKERKKALVACMRKILLHLNSIVRKLPELPHPA
jgi:transposase